MASDTYYNDENQWGNYQFVTLEQIINDYMMSRDQDDYAATVPRHKIVYHARQAFKEFHSDVLQEIRVLSLDLSPETLRIVLPPDYVDFVRISFVDDNGQLQPLASNNRLNISAEHLQDNEFNILFDSNGCPLQDNNAFLEAIKNPRSRGRFGRAGIEDGDLGDYRYYDICNDGFRPNVDASNVFINGSFKVDRRRGTIQFDSTVEGEQIVVEYISDGLFTGCLGQAEQNINIHKFAETAIRDYIHYYLIKNRRNVPAVEKARARKEFYNSRRLTRLRFGALKYSEIIQSFKKSSKWIKN